MKTRLLASLALGLALASPAAVYASDHPVKLHHRHHIAHRQAVERNPAVELCARWLMRIWALSLFGQGTAHPVSRRTALTKRMGSAAIRTIA